MALALVTALKLSRRSAGGGLRLAVAVNGDGSMTATTTGAFAPLRVVVNGDGSMTATGG